MPIGEVSTENLWELGPLCPALIGISSAHFSYLETKGQQPPELIRITALIDTGASHTVIATGLTDRLKLNPIAYEPISSATEAGVHAPVFDVNLMLETNQLIIPNIRVVELNLTQGGIQCLIGRDILRRMLFIYNGNSNSWLLCS